MCKINNDFGDIGRTKKIKAIDVYSFSIHHI